MYLEKKQDCYKFKHRNEYEGLMLQVIQKEICKQIRHLEIAE
jgi:hypothetical protein